MLHTENTHPLKLQIIKTSGDYFLKRGFTSTTAAAISKALGISTGNLTYHFKTKEHLLLELVKEMRRYQWDTALYYINKGDDPLFAYSIEIAMQTALCEVDEIAYDFYVSSYTLPLTLSEMRNWDCKKAQILFSTYNPHWEHKDFVLAEINASGIEISTLLTKCDDSVTLKDKISNALDNLMAIYNVPKSKREEMINKVLQSDYLSYGKKMFEDFRIHLNNIEEKQS